MISEQIIYVSIINKRSRKYVFYYKNTMPKDKKDLKKFWYECQ